MKRIRTGKILLPPPLPFLIRWISSVILTSVFPPEVLGLQPDTASVTVYFQWKTRTCGLDRRVSRIASGAEVPGYLSDHGSSGMENPGPTVTVSSRWKARCRPEWPGALSCTCQLSGLVSDLRLTGPWRESAEQTFAALHFCCDRLFLFPGEEKIRFLCV